MALLNKTDKTSGFTLVELVIVIVVMGILAAVAANYMAPALESGRVEEAKQELDKLALAIVGNSTLENIGARTDYGYVGDNGALPSSLDDLVSDPGLGTWNGPYLNNSFNQNTDDFKTDPWQTEYSLNDVNLTSSGSGSNIVMSLAGSTDELLLNTVTGNVFDIDGTPPGSSYNDSITVQLSYPDGAGAITTKSINPDIGGFFEIDSIPIGKHDLNIIYDAADDTLTRFIAVVPNSTTYGEYRFTSDYWRAGTSGVFAFWADFDTDEDGFSYSDDTFRSTSQPGYATGNRIASGGYSGGALRVYIGNVNNSDIDNMSGGWSRTVTLSNDASIRLSFRYSMDQGGDFESSEYTQVLVSVDGTLHGTSPNDYVAQINGDGDGGPNRNTGWQLFQIDLGTLTAGPHTIVVGGYINRKTYNDEFNEVLIDELSLSEI